MDADPLESAGSVEGTRTGTTILAYSSSMVSALCLVLCLPLLYLFVHLLVSEGIVPQYSQLKQPERERFQAKWDQSQNADDKSTSLLPAQQRWFIYNQQYLESKISPDAKALYDSQSPAGILPLVVQERGRWTERPVVFLAKNFPFLWKSNSSYLLALFGLSLILVSGAALFASIAAHMATLSTIDTTTRVRRALYQHTFRLGALALRKPARDEAADMITDKVTMIQDGTYAKLTSAFRPLQVIFALLVALAVNPWVTLALGLFGALVWLVVGQVAAMFRRDGRTAAKAAEGYVAQIRESVSALYLIKAFLLERFAQARMERLLADVGNAEWRRQRGTALSRPTLAAAAALAAVVMLYFGARVVLGGDLTLAGLSTILVALAMTVLPLRTWVRSLQANAEARAAAAIGAEFLARRGDPGQNIDAEFLQPVTKRLEFMGLSYREPGTGKMVLENVSFAIPAGVRVAFVGTDTTERRTLAHLIARFLEPTAGEIKADGKNLRWVTLESLRTQIAVVTPDPMVFTDTVANNIGCGDSNYSLPQIIEAAKVAHAHQFVQRLPYGYETRIGEIGHALRPGEQFRIALARAILRDPSVVVIEEPNEPFDADTVTLLEDTYSRMGMGRTLLFLPNRESTARQTDRVFLLKNGTLLASGTHEDLLESNATYRRLHSGDPLPQRGGNSQ